METGSPSSECIQHTGFLYILLIERNKQTNCRSVGRIRHIHFYSPSVRQDDLNLLHNRYFFV
ncbi:hypothetical protein I656_03180 [Geobacillus sp. WSUCF1]|nr:hypothetical protein I656_03180 [Geobacillus sp. WSUCF1]